MVNKVRTRRKSRQKNKISQHSNIRVKRSKKFTQKRVKRTKRRVNNKRVNNKRVINKRVNRSKRRRVKRSNSRRIIEGGALDGVKTGVKTAASGIASGASLFASGIASGIASGAKTMGKAVTYCIPGKECEEQKYRDPEVQARYENLVLLMNKNETSGVPDPIPLCFSDPDARTEDTLGSIPYLENEAWLGSRTDDKGKLKYGEMDHFQEIKGEWNGAGELNQNYYKNKEIEIPIKEKLMKVNLDTLKIEAIKEQLTERQILEAAKEMVETKVVDARNELTDATAFEGVYEGSNQKEIDRLSAATEAATKKVDDAMAREVSDSSLYTVEGRSIESAVSIESVIIIILINPYYAECPIFTKNRHLKAALQTIKAINSMPSKADLVQYIINIPKYQEIVTDKATTMYDTVKSAEAAERERKREEAMGRIKGEIERHLEEVIRNYDRAKEEQRGWESVKRSSERGQALYAISQGSDATLPHQPGFRIASAG